MIQATYRMPLELRNLPPDAVEAALRANPSLFVTFDPESVHQICGHAHKIHRNADRIDVDVVPLADDEGRRFLRSYKASRLEIVGKRFASGGMEIDALLCRDKAS